MYPNHWKNPYPAKRRRVPTLQRTKVPSLPAGKEASLIPQRNEARNMKSSLVRVREHVRGVREQLEQMESTIETLFNVMDAVERFGAGSKTGRGEAGLLKTFRNIDFKQVMNLLQSPLVQALMETMAEEAEEPKKKQGKALPGKKQSS